MKPSSYIRRGWCQGTSAKTKVNEPCFSRDPEATQWCLYGSIGAAYPEERHTIEQIVTLLTHLVGNIPKWNDDPKRTKEEVIALLISIGE